MANSNYPFQRLADETISLILQYAATPTINLDPQIYLHGRGERVHSGVHYLGRVSQRWHNISLHDPLVWRHITIFVDIPHTVETLSTSPLTIYLTRSAPLPVCVYLVRKVKVPHTLDLVERRSVEVLLSALKGSFERIESLVVETNQASSLPDFQSLLLNAGDVHWLSGLRSLVLRCDADDSILQPPASSSQLPPIRGQLEVRTMLTTLYVDGRNLLSMLRCSLSRYWSEIGDVFSCMSMLETLGVNNLTFRVDGYTDELVHYFFLDILPSFPRFQTLALDTFEPIDDGHSWPYHGPDFEPPPSRSPPLQSNSTAAPLFSPSMPRLIIKYTKQDSIEFVLKHITPPRALILIHCYLTSPSPIRISNCSELILMDIPTDNHRILPKLIVGWKGKHLDLVSCPCVDGDFWAAFMAELTNDA